MVTWGTIPEQVIPIDGHGPRPCRRARPERRRAWRPRCSTWGCDRATRSPARRSTGCSSARAPTAASPTCAPRPRSCAGSVSRGRARRGSCPVRVDVKRAAEAEGLDRVFPDAGFEWREPGCSMCLAANGERVGPGQRSVSTSQPQLRRPPRPRRAHPPRQPGGRRRLRVAGVITARRHRALRETVHHASRASPSPVPRANIDTDVLIPINRLIDNAPDRLGPFLFEAWRYLPDGSPDPEFALNQPRYAGAEVLVAGENFGCGSSREHAVWALGRVRLPLRDRAQLRRHLPPELLPERRAAAPLAGRRGGSASPTELADAALDPTDDRRSRRRSAVVTPERTRGRLRVRPRTSRGAAGGSRRHRHDAQARAQHSRHSRRPTRRRARGTTERPRRSS